METTTSEIADGIYRFSTYVPEMDFMFNQFLVKGEEPLLFHCGPRQLFPLVSDAMARVIPVEQLKWITFGHVEADECGSMNDWLAAAPDSTVAHTAVGCMVSVGDMADRPPRALAHDEVIDLGGRRVRHLTTPHVPHGWDSGLYFEETTATLLCGDLFSAAARAPRSRSTTSWGRPSSPRTCSSRPRSRRRRDPRSARSPTSSRARSQ